MVKPFDAFGDCIWQKQNNTKRNNNSNNDDNNKKHNKNRINVCKQTPWTTFYSVFSIHAFFITPSTFLLTGTHFIGALSALSVRSRVKPRKKCSNQKGTMTKKYVLQINAFDMQAKSAQAIMDTTFDRNETQLNHSTIQKPKSENNLLLFLIQRYKLSFMRNFPLWRVSIELKLMLIVGSRAVIATNLQVNGNFVCR